MERRAKMIHQHIDPPQVIRRLVLLSILNGDAYIYNNFASSDILISLDYTCYTNRHIDYSYTTQQDVYKQQQ